MSPFQSLKEIPYPTEDGIRIFHTTSQAIYDEWCLSDHSFCDMTPATLKSLDTLPHSCPGRKPSNQIPPSVRVTTAEQQHNGYGGAILAVFSTVVLIFLLLLCIKWCFCLTSPTSATGEDDSKHQGQNGDTDYVHLEDLSGAEPGARSRPADTERDPLLVRPAPAIIASSRGQNGQKNH
ncbi:hypothetical protein B0H67DRAFT_548754 [Lasiosphaeris hirsuta]|uniref:Uncharacterized protein n=1 Tax=Lasiosphaeris hirsuta TaxID=260670 RepID=A0AA40BB29_9PEZI|nr:hypothetical protein B0H67DRAFT_548754 [Lasiosphaeris hirsuta]